MYQLQGWTPIALHAGPGVQVEWADLRGQVFDKPFFSRTLGAWEQSGRSATVLTDLDALEALDEQPSLDPDLIIAHPSRCGSTLLARLASAEDDAVLVSESPIIPELLTCHLKGQLGRPVEPVLRQVVRALGRVRLGTERRYVLKLNSHMARHLPEVRLAFPRTPIVWLQRRPAEIVESNLRRPARAPRELSAPEMAQWVVRRVTLTFLGATAFLDDGMHVLDYRDLPDAAWTRVAGLMGLEPDVARMRQVAQIHAHNGKPYAPAPWRPLPDAVETIVRETLDPMYEALALRGRAA